ncbi:MAG: SCO family protein [Acetobacteraceae bacterium]
MSGAGPAVGHSTGLRAHFERRRLLMNASGLLVLLALPAGVARAAASSTIDVSGWHLPRLSFTMTDATTARVVTARDFQGKLVLLYFGYTNCPDVCPLTLHNIARILDRLDRKRADVRVLFVTVDPVRDTLAVLGHYTRLFAPEIVGLRGTANHLAALARSYHIGYSVSPATASHPYEVTHSSAIYVFDRAGRPRLLIPSLASTAPDIAGTATALKRLLGEGSGPASAISRLF